MTRLLFVLLLLSTAAQAQTYAGELSKISKKYRPSHGLPVLISTVVDSVTALNILDRRNVEIEEMYTDSFGVHILTSDMEVLLTIYVEIPVSLDDMPALTATVYPNGSVWNYHPEISYDHFRFEPFLFNPLVIVYSHSAECRPEFNMDWHRRPPRYCGERVWILTCDYWIPFPRNWPLEDRLIAWMIADFSIMWEGKPVYYQWDFQADGHIDLSDLTFFGLGYGTEWDLSDFSALGLHYNRRSVNAPD